MTVCTANNQRIGTTGTRHFQYDDGFDWSISDHSGASTSNSGNDFSADGLQLCTTITDDVATGGHTRVNLLSVDDTADTTTTPSADVRIFWLDINHVLHTGEILDGDTAINKPSSHHRIITDGWDFGRQDIYFNPDWSFSLSITIPEIVSAQQDVDGDGDLDDAFICNPDGTPFGGDNQQARAVQSANGGAAGTLEICVDIHSDDEGTDRIRLEFDFGAGRCNGTCSPILDSFSSESIRSNFLFKEWTHTPVEIVHVQSFPTNTDGQVTQPSQCRSRVRGNR